MTLDQTLDAEVQRIDLLIDAALAHRDGKSLPAGRRDALQLAQTKVTEARRQGHFAALLQDIPDADQSLALDGMMIVVFPLLRPSLARRLAMLAPAGQSTETGVLQTVAHELLMPDRRIEARLSRLFDIASPLLRGAVLRADGEGTARVLRPGIRLVRAVSATETAVPLPDGVRLALRGGESLPPLHLSAPTARRLDEITRMINLVHSSPNTRWTGPSVLFTGGPGTGKSLAVCHLAQRLQRPLYEIDLGRVISKWVGETERNMSGIFDSLSGTEGMIVANEADALLGKRIEVRDGRDQYANVTVSHLLALLERHRGPVFLTTNLRANVDTAYIRRFAAVVEFRRPDPQLRAAIWRDALMAAFPALRATALAEILPLLTPLDASAAEITNIAMVATALSDGQDLPDLALLARAVWLEMTKSGTTFARSDLGRLAPYLSPEAADVA